MMNNHEKEQHYKAKKAEMKQKYAPNLKNFHAYHGVDESVQMDMLLFNAKCFASGITKEIIPGGGAVNVPELVKDYRELAQYIVWQQ